MSLKVASFLIIFQGIRLFLITVSILHVFASSILKKFKGLEIHMVQEQIINSFNKAGVVVANLEMLV